MNLTEQRKQAATEFWNKFNSKRYQVEDADGFEFSTGEDVFKRTVYVYDLFQSNSSVTKVLFSITFEKDSTQIDYAWLGAERLI